MADFTFDCPQCSHNLIVDAQAAGLVVACPECGTQLLVPTADEEAESGEPAVPATVDDAKLAAEPASDSATVPAPAPEMALSGTALEYKVVSMLEGEGESGRLTAEAVEFKLNELMQDGWRLRSTAAIQTRDWLGNPKQEILLIMERHI